MCKGKRCDMLLGSCQGFLIPCSLFFRWDQPFPIFTASFVFSEKGYYKCLLSLYFLQCVRYNYVGGTCLWLDGGRGEKGRFGREKLFKSQRNSLETHLKGKPIALPIYTSHKVYATLTFSLPFHNRTNNVYKPDKSHFDPPQICSILNCTITNT